MAGFWNNLFSTTKTTHSAVSAPIVGAVSSATNATTGVVGKGLGVIGTGVGSAVGATTGVLSGVLHPIKKPAKWAAIIGGTALVTGAAAYFLRKPARADRKPVEPVMDMMPPPMPVMMDSPNTLMGMEPTPGALANREMARRGQAPQVAAGAMNPDASAVVPANVASLGK